MGEPARGMAGDGGEGAVVGCGGVKRHKPALAELLGALRMDVAYHRASGDFLYYRDERGREIEVLDFAGGYGALLLGHAHPALTRAAAAFWRDCGASLVQGSIGARAEELAAELSRRAGGDYAAVFANSGAEAVEAAVKHAMLETGGRTIVALGGAFHGKTLGAVQLTDNPAYRGPFALGGLNVRRVTPNKIDLLDACLRTSPDLAGCIVEPIQGEAGVRPLTAEFLQRAAALCRARGAPLIVDECQTGLGRTGEFLASRALGVAPDYVILSKGLGGGIAKRSAVLIDRRRYRGEFDLLHTSTFADDEFSSAVALAALELLDDALLARARRQGARLRARLERVAADRPAAAAEVRGAGLMLGLELRPQTAAPSLMLRLISRAGMLGPLAAAYLLRVHRVRVAPTLSDPLTLRVQPSALVEDAQIERFGDALDDFCARVERGDVAGLTRFLAEAEGREYRLVLPQGATRQAVGGPLTFGPATSAPKNACGACADGRVGWLFHLIDESDLSRLEPALAALSRSERRALVNRFSPLAEPVLLAPAKLRARSGARVALTPILLPVTSGWLRRMFVSRRFEPLRALVQRGVDAAEACGCQIAALGQFTSIVTRNGESLDAGRMGLTTGNSYTVALAVQAVRDELAVRGLDPGAATLAVVGAAGNIGAACTELLAGEFARTVLLGSGSASSLRQLARLAERCGAAASSDARDLSSADVVLCATNSVDLELAPELFARHAIVCDVSVPSALHAGVKELRPDVSLVAGGVCRLPHGEDLGIPGFPLPVGSTYGCMAEGILLGFEGETAVRLVGAVSLAEARRLARLAAKHGVERGELRRRLAQRAPAALVPRQGECDGVLR